MSKSKAVPFRELYATGSRADTLISLASDKGKKELYARLQFAEQDVHKVRGEFFGYHAYDDSDQDYGDPHDIYIAPEGKAILLLSKLAP